jgi:hypothetical protein
LGALERLAEDLGRLEEAWPALKADISGVAAKVDETLSLFKGLETLKDSTNGDTPSSKKIKPAPKSVSRKKKPFGGRIDHPGEIHPRGESLRSQDLKTRH